MLSLSRETTIKNPFEFHDKPIICVYGSGEGNVYIRDQVIQILRTNGYINLNCETHNSRFRSGGSPPLSSAS